MSILFTYHGRIYASIPSAPIVEGTAVLVVHSHIGFVEDMRAWRRHIGVVQVVCMPGTPQHHMWRYRFGPDYVIPRADQTVVQVLFDDNDVGIFLTTDVLHVAWLSCDVHPAALPANFYFPPY
jgi:hypothetical protein